MEPSHPTPESRGRPTPEPPSGPRLWLVNAALVFVLAGSLFDIATFREHWPFSPYWMYSHARVEHTLSAMRVVGVPTGGNGSEFDLQDPRYIYPFDLTKLRVALTRMAETSADPERLRAALRDCVERYEALRRAGAHGGPELSSIRLYRFGWTLDPWARNAHRPERRELIAEEARPDRGRN